MWNSLPPALRAGSYGARRKWNASILSGKRSIRSQLLFGINQGAIFKDIRISQAEEISAMDLDGYAIGGLAVGESAEQMYEIIECTTPHLPKDKPTYLMG
jgi:tRNA-guanine family transglycosylase